MAVGAERSIWRVAWGAMRSRFWITLAALALSAASTVLGGDGTTLSPLALGGISVLMILSQILVELHYFTRALRAYGGAADRPWRPRRVLGFLLRWAAIAAIFTLMPVAVFGLLAYFAFLPAELAASTILISVSIVVLWVVGYAAMGSALPDYLAGGGGDGGGGLGAALGRPGFWRRLRDLGATAALLSIASVAPYELWEAFVAQVGPVPPYDDQAALLRTVEMTLVFSLGDLITLFAAAVMAAVVTADLMTETSRLEGVERVFE